MVMVLSDQEETQTLSKTAAEYPYQEFSSRPTQAAEKVSFYLSSQIRTPDQLESSTPPQNRSSRLTLR